MTHTKALKLALEALEWCHGGEPCGTAEAITAIKAALEQPPQRTWVGLTDEEMKELWEVSRAALPRYATYASLVEAKLKEKNT